MLTAIVLTKNEAKNIADCLASLGWVDELIIIDDYSKDATVTLAKKAGAKIYRRKLNNNFASQRNFGLKKARGEWVLFVDADERVSQKLKEEIKKAIQNPRYQGYYLRRLDYLWGQPLRHGEPGHIWLLRLAKKNAGCWQRQVHEVWQIKGPTAKLKKPLIHYPHQNLSEFIDHLNFHSTLHSQALQKEGKNYSIIKLIFLPIIKFFQNYFFRLGFLDKMPGLIAALMMSWHSFLSQAKGYVKNH